MAARTSAGRRSRSWPSTCCSSGTTRPRWPARIRPLDALQEAHETFIAQNAAVLRGGNRLHPSLTATSIRRTADGGIAVSDGAFAETKEVIGGYYLIDVPDLDEALRIAVQVPAPFGGVEVRPVWPAGGQEAR